MVRSVVALAAGLLFGFGLLLSGMYDPAKVFGFLDLAGAWDPSLAFVMGGAITVAAPAFAFARKRCVAATGEPLSLPKRRDIDAPLLLGAAIFGIGWGLGGICPGPGIVDVGFLSSGAAIFVAAMALGALIYCALDLRLRSPRALTQDA